MGYARASPFTSSSPSMGPGRRSPVVPTLNLGALPLLHPVDLDPAVFAIKSQLPPGPFPKQGLLSGSHTDS